ncbi:MAG: ribonuclease R [Robiginitomaculum sp.]|nr:ribonuclease R [Robiginitomaculum sp.]MDQ7077406.1 ribonuclease R [Robiginitomaculum sp.]
MALSKRILSTLEQNGKGLSKRDIARELKLFGKEKAGLKEALRALEEAGKIERQDRRKYAIAGRLPNVFVAEFYDRDLDGELLARPVAWQSETPPPVIILAPGEADGDHGAAIGIGEKALIRVTRDDGGYTARIIKKLAADQSASQRLLGVARKVRGGVQINPTTRKSRRPMTLRPLDADKIEDGDLVVVAETRERKYGAPLVKLVERLGDVNAPRAASMIALVEHGIPQGFTDEEIAEAEAAKPATLGKRTDLRTLPLITIDPDDARDFDDAVHARADTDPKNPGGWVVTVAIADVAAYVKGASALDRGALKRGNSVYLPDQVVPMLPERLSNDLCSLRPHEDRACMAVQMVFDANGQKRKHTFMRALMRSHARLSYTQAQNAIDGKPDETAAPVLEDVLKPLWAAYEALKIARAKRSPLEIESTERKIRVNEQGKIASITKQERFDAHRLIEEFMVSANVCAAETLERKTCPLIYRVHDAPSAEKLHALSDFLRTIDIKWAKGERATTKRFNTLIRKTRDGKYAEIVNEMVLRTQMQAIYDTQNIGHFGLNLNHYAHFTSPIRRYADLTVHRALIRACKLGDDGATNAEQSQLKSIAQDITAHERRAMAAERDATGRYIASYLSEHVGNAFAASISGVTRFGLFLRLEETGADGFVPIRQLGREFFVHDEKAHALVGRETGGRYTLGQAVKAELMEATPLTGGLLFEMLTPPVPGPRPGKSARTHRDHHSKSAKHRRKRRN